MLILSHIIVALVLIFDFDKLWWFDNFLHASFSIVMRLKFFLILAIYFLKQWFMTHNHNGPKNRLGLSEILVVPAVQAPLDVLWRSTKTYQEYKLFVYNLLDSKKSDFLRTRCN